MALGDVLKGVVKAGTAARLGHVRGREDAEEKYRQRRQDEREESREARALDLRDEAMDARTRQIIQQEALLQFRRDQAEEAAGRPRAPVMGTPEYLEAQEDLTAMRARHRPPPRSQTPPDPNAPLRRNIVRVEQQIGDTQSDLGRAEQRVNKRPTFFRSPSDSLSYEGDKDRLSGLRRRSDSLSSVRDSMVNDLIRGAASQGGQRNRDEIIAEVLGGNAPGAPAEPQVSFAEQRQMQEEFNRAAERYKRLLARPGVNPVEAQRAYDATVEQIARRYGAIR